VTRDDAVRAVSAALGRHYGDDVDEWYLNEAAVAVAALVAAGWGDLAAERERLAVAVTEYGKKFGYVGRDHRDYVPLKGLARLIRDDIMPDRATRA